MNKTSTLNLALVMASAMAFTSVNAAVKKNFKGYAGPLVSVPGSNERNASSLQLQKLGIPAQARRFAAPQVGNDPVSQLTAPGFGWLEGPDGTQWYYTQKFNKKDGYSYSGSVVELFDSSNQPAGSFTVDVPEDLSVNSIDVFGAVTKKLFDRDEKTSEVLVSIHAVGNADNNYKDTYITRAYRTDGSGVAFETKGSGVLFDASEGFSTYQRLLVVNNEETVVSEGTEDTDPVVSSNIRVDVWAAPGWGDTEAKVEHTFNIDFDLWNYSMGSYINCYNIGGQPYYVVAKFLKPYASGYDDDYNMIVNKDNKYVLTTYDRYYNQVDSIALPVQIPDDKLYRFGAFGVLGVDDLSKGYWDDDTDNLTYVMTWVDYSNATDGNTYTFELYDHNGNKLRDICKNAVENQWFTLKPIPGISDQMAFLEATEDGASQQIRMLNVPDCETAAVIPAEIDGDGITSTLDRYPSGKNSEGYQYVVNMRNGGVADNGDVLARIGWYNPDLTLDHMVNINLGQEGEYFTPLINATTLNPYLFDTDNEMEYIYIAKKRRTDGSNKIDNVLEVAKESGEILRSYRGDDDFRFRTAALPAMTDTKNQLFVANYSDDSQDWQLNFYDLPFNKFAKGGDGTPASPYLVSTAGDLQQIANDTKANYRLTDNIDLFDETWSPIATFDGTLDGDNHAITYMSVASGSSNAGLFGTLNPDSKVSNLTFVYPEINVNEDNMQVGVLAGDAVQSTIDNVHVIGAEIKGDEDADPTVGGIIGQAALNTKISSSSFDGEMGLPGASTVGGIVADMRTGSEVNASSVSMSANAVCGVGGIAGTIDGDSRVTNSRANVDITAGYAIGGIVAISSRGTVDKCVAMGSINATGQDWSGTAAGGIVGKLNSDWSGDGSTKVVSNCFSSANITLGEDDTDASTVHNIVGWTSVNDWYEEGEEPIVEKGIANNYTSVDAQADDDASVGGKYHAAEGDGSDFFKSLGYAYGESVEAPWKNDTKAFEPVLYFDKLVGALALEQTSITTTVSDDPFTLDAEVLGVPTSACTATSSDESVVKVVGVESEDSYSIEISLKAVGTGVATVTVKAGNMTAECVVTVNSATGVSNAVAGGNTKSTVYYDLGGRAANAPASGIFIKKVTMSDGSVKAQKVVVK